MEYKGMSLPSIKIDMKPARQAGVSLETFLLRIKCYDKLYTIRWFDLYLSRTLRDILKWLISR